MEETKEINILELLNAAKNDFSLEATMIVKDKRVRVMLRFNVVYKMVTVQDFNSENPNDVFELIPQLLNKVKFLENL